jgi:hypothetical protein
LSGAFIVLIGVRCQLAVALLLLSRYECLSTGDCDPKGPKRRRLQQASNLLHQVASKQVRPQQILPDW